MEPFGKNFSLGHLGAFMAVLRCGTIAAAGEELCRSTSAVSRSITLLEEKFGKRLLTRSQSGVSATGEGALVAERSDIIHSELSALRSQLIEAGNSKFHTNAATLNMHVDVSRLRALIAVQEFGSVQRASHALAITQPAVSASIRHVESDLGLQLFQRTPSGMIPTPAGVTSTLCFKRVLSELRRMTDDVASHDGTPSGVVCVGGLAFSRSALLPEAMKRALTAFPEIVVRTVEGPIYSLIAGMHAGEIDALICAQPNPALLDGVSVEPIVRDPMRLYVSKNHPLAKCKKLSAEELLEHPFILPPKTTVTRDLLDTVFSNAGGGLPHGSVETSSYSVIRYLLLNSHLISFRSVMEFHADLPYGDIVELDLDFELPSRTICLLQRNDVRRTAAVNAFLQIVHDVANGGSLL